MIFNIGNHEHAHYLHMNFLFYSFQRWEKCTGEKYILQNTPKSMPKSSRPSYEAVEIDRLDRDNLSKFVPRRKKNSFLSWWEEQKNQTEQEGQICYCGFYYVSFYFAFFVSSYIFLA